MIKFDKNENFILVIQNFFLLGFDPSKETDLVPEIENQVWNRQEGDQYKSYDNNRYQNF